MHSTRTMKENYQSAKSFAASPLMRRTELTSAGDVSQNSIFNVVPPSNELSGSLVPKLFAFGQILKV